MNDISLILDYFKNFDYFFVILALNIVSTATGTLKSIMIVKYGGKLTGLVVGIDTLIYGIVLKSFSTTGASAIIAYCIGNVVGYFLGSKVNEKLALGMSDIQVYVKDYETMMSVQKELIEEDYSSTCEVGIIDETTSRYSLNIQTTKKEIENIKEIFKRHGVNNPTMLVREIESVTGKIAKRM